MIPLKKYLGIAIALFHWSPATFWSSTPYEFFAAVESHIEIMSGESNADYEDWYDSMPDHLKT